MVEMIPRFNNVMMWIIQHMQVAHKHVSCVMLWKGYYKFNKVYHLTVLVTVGLPLPLPLSGNVFLLSVFCTMNLFTPNKSASPPKDSDNRGVEPSVGPSPSSQTNPDLEALVRQQAAELEGLRRRRSWPHPRRHGSRRRPWRSSVAVSAWPGG